MSQRTKISIFNAALTRTGNNPVATGDGSAISMALEANYDEIVRSLFEGQEFPFGKARVTLTSRAEGDYGYDDAFTYPAEILHIQDVFLNGYRAADLLEAWEINAENRQLMINAESRKVEIEGIKQGLEHTWSSRFTLAVQLRLEAVIKDVLEEAEESSAKESAADYQLMQAGMKGSRNRSKVKARRGGRLTRAHSGRMR